MSIIISCNHFCSLLRVVQDALLEKKNNGELKTSSSDYMLTKVLHTRTFG